MIKILLLTILFSLPGFAQEKKPATEADFEKETELIDFKSIRKVLQNDMLGTEVEKKQKRILKIKKAKKKKKVAKYNIPGEYDFWTFFSEYWLVKNATILKWDFKKPDYGVEHAFRLFLEKLGIYELKFRILLLNTPDVTHFALPSNNGEIIFLLSVPFIRTLDLSKLEISLLLFEDYVRWKMDLFKDAVTSKKLQSFIGSNFFGKKMNMAILKELSEKYDSLIFDKGFNFQQQFKVTKRVSSILKGDVKLWNTYYTILKKINELVHSNFLYKKYSKIYPSPELQLNWLKPKQNER